MEIKVLPAFNGDCLIISFLCQNRQRHILVDGGISKTYPLYLKPALEKIRDADEFIDLLIVTHIDDDHIGGIKKLYEDVRFDRSFIKQIWFNSGTTIARKFTNMNLESREVKLVISDTLDMGFKQAATLESLLIKEGWKAELITTGITRNLYDMRLWVLSPKECHLRKLNEKWQVETSAQVEMGGKGATDYSRTLKELLFNSFKEDDSIPNGSSIALLIELAGKKILLLADAHPSVIAESLKNAGFNKDHKFEVDIVKISHHASKANTSPELITLIDSKAFIICSDGSKHNLPNKEALARIIDANPGCALYFNYPALIDKIFSANDFQDYHFSCCDLSKSAYVLNI